MRDFRWASPAAAANGSARVQIKVARYSCQRREGKPRPLYLDAGVKLADESGELVWRGWVR
jgi:hypothetical protein